MANREYLCERCRSRFDTQREIRGHICKHHQTNNGDWSRLVTFNPGGDFTRYNCDFCDFSTTESTETLRSHWQSVHIGREIHVTSTSSRQALNAPMHRLQSQVGFSGTGTQPTMHLQSLSEGVSTHTARSSTVGLAPSSSTRPPSIMVLSLCPFCNQQFHFESLARHVVEQHGGQFSSSDLEECPVCSQLFLSEADLHRHYREKHECYSNYRCSHCNEIFFDEITQRNHERICNFRGSSAATVAGIPQPNINQPIGAPNMFQEHQMFINIH